MKKDIYYWNRNDKIKYLLVLSTWLLAVGIGMYFIALFEPWFVLVYIGSYLLLTYLQAWFYCIGCPYRGRFCPAIMNMILANFLAATLLKKKLFSEKRCLQVELLVLVPTLLSIGLPLIFIWGNWLFTALYLCLFIGHFMLEFRLHCIKCSFRYICPGGKMACRIFKERG